MVQCGELGLDDPISKYLPKSLKLPKFDEIEITLAHLATHNSGLPPMLYTDSVYPIEQIYSILSNSTLMWKPGSKYQYSNFGVGLLGHILSLRAGIDFGTLVRNRICRPLNLQNTGVNPASCSQYAIRKRMSFAVGHNESLDPTTEKDADLLSVTLPGSGGLYSTAKDLVKFMAANLGRRRIPSLPAREKARQSWVESPLNRGMGLGWHLIKIFDSEILWHNGQTTGGYYSFVGLNRQKCLGVSVLSNSSKLLNDIGFHLLDGRHPLEN